MKKILLLIYVFAVLAVNAQTSPAGFTTTKFIGGLINPVAFVFTPDRRVFITQKGGASAGAAVNAKIFTYSSSGTLLATFYNLTDSVNSNFERGLLGVTIDPDFTNNHYVYAYYNHKYGTKNAIRVVRFTEQNNVGINPKIILDISVGNIAGNHVGGNIHFRKSEPTKLYVTIGETAVPAHAQVLTNPFGKFLRINSDGTIPTDNPFYDDGNPATGNDDRIWSYGHRNPFDFTFGPNDTHYCSENGENAWDEANVVEKGKNYGWATCEGDYLRASTTQACTNVNYVAPIATWGAKFGPQANKLPSVTGILYYSGSVIPELDNHLLVTENNFGGIFDLTLGNPPKYDKVTQNKLWVDLISSDGGLTTILQGDDGCIYAMQGGYTNNGAIYKICKKESSVNETAALENVIGQNYPNPANNSAQIDYSLAQAGKVEIALFDITGREVRNVLSAEMHAGKHTVTVPGLASLPTGTYFYSIKIKDATAAVIYQATKRMLISH